MEELESLCSLVAEGRNVLLYGPRRLGKSSLLAAALDRLDDDHLTVYVDCTRKETDREVARVVLEEFGRTGQARVARFWDRLKRWLEGTQVRIVQPSDGPPRLELEPGGSSERSLADALEAVGRFAEAADQRLVVALDEFQVVMDRDAEGGRIAAVRSVVQRQPHVTYVLSGSETTVLKRLVEDREAPFWRQLVEFPLPGLGVDDVADDLADHFDAFPDDAKAAVRDACGTNTLRLVEVLDRLWRMDAPVTEATARDAVEAVAELHAPDFERELSLAKPGHQRRVLLGLARDRPDHPMGAEFIRAHELNTPATARRALTRLQDLGILDEDYAFTDPLFAWYLRQEGG